MNGENSELLDLGTPYPKQIEFFEAKTTYVAYGGARGGGKSWAARTKAILLALCNPGIQILFLRRTLNELRENHSVPLQKILKCRQTNKIAVYKDQEKVFIFPNEARLKLGYCDNEDDVLQYQGQAYDVIFMEEATQFTEYQFQCLTESNRSSGLCLTNFKPRMYFTCNPGGVGHLWVKRLFIDKRYTPTENPDDYTFIPSLVYENKYLMEHDPGYIKKLENLPEDRKRAMLYGDWDVFSGQYFSEFSRRIHVCESFEIPNHWNRYIALDYGLDKFAVLFFAIDTKGEAYVYNQIHKEDLIVSEASQLLKSYMRKTNYKAIFAPPDLWNRNRDTGKSTAEVFRENGIVLLKAGNNREQGWLEVKEWLKAKKRRNEQTGEIEEYSNLHIFNNCTTLIEYLPQLQHDEKNPNDCARQPHELTHICDALRYFCVSRTSPSKEIINKEKTFNFEVERPIYGEIGEEIVVI